MRRWLVVLLLGGALASAQNSSSNSQASSPDSGSQHGSTRKPDLTPPRSDTVNVKDLGDEPGESSSKDDPVDLSPPPDDAKTHPHSSDMIEDEGSGDTGELRPWDPHKAAKDVEVGDFYFKKKNYVAAESRYREALYYKDNDAIATYRLAVCLEKLDRTDEARAEYESYLKILPYGPEAPEATKAIERLKTHAASAKPTK
jgi:tetratricopeptide (TPR) repeat protein